MTGNTILIIGDEAGSRGLLQATLEGEGFSVHAASGEQALSAARELHPRLMLVGVERPGWNGFEVARSVKADPTTRDILVIAVTSTAQVDRDDAIASGCDGCLATPIDPVALPAELSRYLGREPLVVPSAEATVSTPRILVVEDNPTARKMIRVALQSHGYMVLEAGDGRTALAHARETRPDLILQDLILPDMDGFELLRRMRELPGGSATPTLCLSGFVGRLDEARAMSAAKGTAGFSAVLVKPVDPISLLEIVRKHLQRPPLPEVQDSGGHRILVVDDDPLQRRLAEHYLSSAGFRVSLATSGGDALEQALRLVPDAIISNVLMPEMDGFQLCLAIRQEPRLDDVPVVLISSPYVEAVDKALARKVGASTLVPRSGDLGAAMRAVVEVLAQGKSGHARLHPIELADSVRAEMIGRTSAQLDRQVRNNVQLSQQSLMQAAQLSVLAGVTDALARKASLSDVLGDVLAACLDMAGIAKGALLLRAGDELQPQHTIGFSPSERDDLAALFGGREFFARVTDQKATVSLPSPGPALAAESAFLARAGIASALLAPVLWGERGYGVLFLGARITEAGGDEPIAFARVLGAQIGQAIGLAEAFEGLQASEERFRALSESMDDRVIVLDRDHRAIGLYGRWTGQDGWRPDQIMSRPIEELLGSDPLGLHRSAHDRAFAGESVVYEWSGKEGEQARYVQTVVSPIRDGKGEVSAVVRVSRDVTEQKSTQAQLMVSDRLATVGMLAAGVAHEINNPLAAVIANLELAQQDAALWTGPRGAPSRASSLKEAISDAREGAERVRQIVRDLKVFSRADEGDRGSAVDVELVMESSLRMAWNEVRHRAKIVKDYGIVPAVAAMESRLGQVFLNLLVNAAQAIPPGCAETNQIGISVQLDPSGQVLVEIRDTGPGMPPEIVRQLFTPFFTTKPKGLGTGLGLSICQRIVTDLGGSLTVTSQVGLGTTFRVLLPTSPEPPPLEKTNVQAVAATKRGSILVIDDDAMIGTAVQRALRAEHDIAVMTDARLCIERIRSGERFDAILCDLMMPELTGMDFYRTLREFAPDQAERIVFFTGASFSRGAREFLEEVPNTFLEKPFRIQSLRSAINLQVH